MALGGADRNRTCDPLNANQVLSQLSYSPHSYVISLLFLLTFYACGPGITFVAHGPFSPLDSMNSTSCPSERVLKPSI